MTDSVVTTFRVDEKLLKEFEKYAKEEFGNRNKALVFLIQIYVESRRKKSILEKLLKL